MVKLSGPALSVDALGTLAKTLVFSTAKGRRYVRRHVKPKDPKSAAQIGARAMFQFVQTEWSGVSDANKATWSAAAIAAALSTNNAYCRANLDRWSHFKAPGHAWPIGETGDLPGASFDASTGPPGSIILTISVWDAADAWGCAMFHDSPPPVVPSKANCLALVKIDGAADFTFVHRGLAPGNYYYNAICFTLDGKWGPEEGTKEGTAT